MTLDDTGSGDSVRVWTGAHGDWCALIGVRCRYR